VNENLTLTEIQSPSDLFGQVKSETIGNIPDCHGRSWCESMTLEKKLEMWIEAYCFDVRPITRERFKEMNDIFRTIYKDHRFWRYQTEENRDSYYEDALSNMWQYFWNNLCEVKTARKRSPLVPLAFWWKWYLEIENNLSDLERFESWFFCFVDHQLSMKARSFLDTRDYAVGRLLTNLKGHLQNIESQMRKDMTHQKQPRVNGDNNPEDPMNELPNPEPNLAVRQFEEFLNLLEEDRMGELKDKDNTLRGIKKSTAPYELTAQTYLLMRYRDDKTIQQIADELDIPRGSLQGGAKPTRWKALAQKYAEMAMNNLGQE
jgi:hypothetical protein